MKGNEFKLNNKKKYFVLKDILYLSIFVFPLIVAIILKVLFTPQSDSIQISGALIYFTIPLPFGGLPITESQVNSWLVIISILGLCLYITHGITEECNLKRQNIAEIAVEKTKNLISENMGEFFSGYAPFIAAVICLSAFSSLITLFGLYPPTSDLNVVGGWAILVFILITYYKCKCGFVNYLKSFTEPFIPFTPFNIVSEFATPISMAFRHYGNVISGSVISVLVASFLKYLSGIVFGKLPGILGNISFFGIGIPAVLSAYFDVFSSLLQAFIFAMLTMLYISGGFQEELFIKRESEKKKKSKLNKKIKI